MWGVRTTYFRFHDPRCYATHRPEGTLCLLEVRGSSSLFKTTRDAAVPNSRNRHAPHRSSRASSLDRGTLPRARRLIIGSSGYGIHCPNLCRPGRGAESMKTPSHPRLWDNVPANAPTRKTMDLTDRERQSSSNEQDRGLQLIALLPG